jgi:virulence factor Mce-like protein
MLLLIGVALLGILVVLFGWRAFGGTLPLQPQGYRVEVPLPEALNMEVGADVLISGVHVGDVVAVGQDDFRPVVTVELAQEYAPLRAGAAAIPRTKSLLGEAYIEMTAGRVGSAAIPDGGRLPESSVRESQPLDKVLEAFTPAARRNFQRFVKGAAGAVRGRGQELSASIADAAPATTQLADVLTTLAVQRDDVSALIANSGQVFGALGEREGALADAVTAGNAVLASTARRERDLRATVRGLPGFLRSLTGVSRRIEAASGEVDRAVVALRPAAPKVAPVLRELETTAPVASQTFERLLPTMAAGERGLPAARRLVTAVGPSFADAHLPLREVIPVLELLAEVRGSVVAFFANVAQLVNGTVELPGGVTGGVVSAVPSVWNETIGGWVKKLPSSRYNPYPKPGSAREIARGGLLSYDCRHTGNRLYVPPTGLQGAPPCREQGPWTFGGTTAYYPRLQLSPP